VFLPTAPAGYHPEPADLLDDDVSEPDAGSHPTDQRDAATGTSSSETSQA
jgi:hypothetical protein